MKVFILSGSARSNSGTYRVAQAIESQFSDATILDYVNYDLPNFNEDLSNLGSTSFQKSLVQGMKTADLVIVVTPEYNWFPSAEIVNTVHLLGGDMYNEVFDNSVFAFVGVSAGRGGRMPAVQLSYVFNKVIQFFNLSSVVSAKSFESQETFKCIDEKGKLLDNELYNKGLKQFIDYNVKLAKRWHHMS